MCQELSMSRGRSGGDGDMGLPVGGIRASQFKALFLVFLFNMCLTLSSTHLKIYSESFVSFLFRKFSVS